MCVLDNSRTNQLAEIDIWTFLPTDVSFRLVDVADPRWSFRPKPKAAFRLTSFWRKQLAPVNLHQKSGAISAFICRSGAAMSVSVCAMVIQMVICISRELSSKNLPEIGQDLLRQKRHTSIVSSRSCSHSRCCRLNIYNRLSMPLLTEFHTLLQSTDLHYLWCIELLHRLGVPT